MEFLVEIQTWIHSAVSENLGAFGTSGSTWLLLGFVPLGALFGAIHALTPGHGKTILASYLVGAQSSVAGGAGVAGLLSAVHVGSAVVLALLGAPLLARTIVGAGRSDAIEAVSYVLLVLIGVWLVARAFLGQRHVHDREGWLVAVVAGLVPCPLTLFVMVLALSRGIPEAGLSFAIGMLLGIALTLSLVAAATVFMRDAVAGLLVRHGPKVAFVGRLLEGVSGGLLVLFGALALAA